MGIETLVNFHMPAMNYPAFHRMSVLVFALLSLGGFYYNTTSYVGKLTIYNHVLAEADDRAVVAATGDRHGWHVAVPLVQNRKGQFLAYSMDPKSPSAVLTFAKGDPIQWVFRVIETYRPKSSKNGSKGDDYLVEGVEGMVFELSAKSGPFAGWYLALGPEPTDPKAPHPLVLSTDRKKAVPIS